MSDQPGDEAATVRDVAARQHPHPRHHHHLHLQEGAGHQVGPHHRGGQQEHRRGVQVLAGQHLPRHHQHQHHQERGGAAGRDQQDSTEDPAISGALPGPHCHQSPASC